MTLLLGVAPAPSDRPVALVESGDITPCKVTPVILHEVVSDTSPCRMTAVTRAISPDGMGAVWLVECGYVPWLWGALLYSGRRLLDSRHYWCDGVFFCNKGLDLTH